MSKQRTNDIVVRTAPMVGGYYAQHKGTGYAGYGPTASIVRKLVQHCVTEGKGATTKDDWRWLLEGVRVV